MCFDIVFLFRMGDYVTLGGRVGVRDHVTIVSKVRVKITNLSIMFSHVYHVINKSCQMMMLEIQVLLAAASCVTKNITKPGQYGGFPAVRIFIICSIFHLIK